MAGSSSQDTQMGDCKPNELLVLSRVNELSSRLDGLRGDLKALQKKAVMAEIHLTGAESQRFVLEMLNQNLEYQVLSLLEKSERDRRDMVELRNQMSSGRKEVTDIQRDAHQLTINLLLVQQELNALRAETLSDVDDMMQQQHEPEPGSDVAESSERARKRFKLQQDLIQVQEKLKGKEKMEPAQDNSSGHSSVDKRAEARGQFPAISLVREDSSPQSPAALIVDSFQVLEVDASAARPPSPATVFSFPFPSPTPELSASATTPYLSTPSAADSTRQA